MPAFIDIGQRFDLGEGEELKAFHTAGFLGSEYGPFLIEFASWPPSPRERDERLEQLRALDRGVPIAVYDCEPAGMGVDTPEQLEALERRGPRS